MARVLVTGSSGTVGSALCAALRERGDEPIGWDRTSAPPGDERAGAALLDRIRPDAIAHLAVPSTGTGVPDEGRLVGVRWTRALAEACAQRDIRFLYTSTVMVFTDDAHGPFSIDSEPDAREGYGAEKLAGEREALEANPRALVARLGWQIGDGPEGNNMVAFMAAKSRDEGIVRASRLWKPAMSFVGDTARALIWLLDQPGGVYLLDGNRAGHTFDRIARAVSDDLHNSAYTIEPDDSFEYDQRMIDERVPIAQLEERLRSLRMNA
ncbi:MAG: sugar nucleotide-binding protein [Phycisphaerales bacterium]